MRRRPSYITTLITLTMLVLFSTLQPALAISPPFPAIYYLRSTASTVITPNSWQLVTTAPGSSNSSTRITVDTSTTEFQFWPGVRRTAPTGGLTNGYGWIYDTPLTGQFDAGTWTFYVRLRYKNAPVTGVVRAYVKRYNAGTDTYTNLFTATSASITLPSSVATYSFTAAPGAVDMQGDEYLYVHYSWQSSSGGSGASVEFYVNDGVARITTPGSSIDTLGVLLTIFAISFFIAILVKKRILYVKKVSIA